MVYYHVYNLRSRFNDFVTVKFQNVCRDRPAPPSKRLIDWLIKITELSEDDMNKIHLIYTRRLENKDVSQEISKLKMRLQ